MYPTEDTHSPPASANLEDRTMLRGAPARANQNTGEALAPGVLKTRFVLEGQLGSGGMGTVYRAKDLRKVEAQDQQPYLAIKVLNGDFRQHPDAFIALQREAAKSQSLSHQNIVKIFDFDKDGDVPFMTMELLEGNELSELLRQFPQGLPESLAWGVIRGFCSALKHAHSEGVIHADLKPGNLFVTHSGQVKIFDFGLARAVQANFVDGGLHKRSDVDDLIFDAAALGALTPAFASRAMLGGAPPTATDDLFAAAVVIYQILTGKHPYNRIPADKVDARTVQLERPRLLSSRQWRALSQALALDEGERLGGVAELQSAFFEKSPWPMRLFAFGLGLTAIVMWASNLHKDSELKVVQQQAVTAGRVEAGLDRVLELIEHPTFDTAWEQRLDDELRRLSKLPESQEVRTDAMAHVASLYLQRVAETEDLDAAIALLERGEKFGNMAEGWASVTQRLQAELDWQLDAPIAGHDSFSRIEKILASLSAVAPNRHQAALAELDVNSTYLYSLREGIGAVPDELAQRILATLANREFDMERVASAQTSRDTQAESVAEEMQRDKARLAVADFGEAFQRRGCSLGDLPALKAGHSRLLTDASVNRGDLANRTDLVLEQCTRELLVVDADTADSFRREATGLFGKLPRTQAVLIDPCDRQYLIDAGLRSGRAGSCQDDLAGAPELVVMRTPESVVAITRREISRAEYSGFCRAEGGADCAEGDPRFPVTGVGVESVHRYAAWLSKQSGFTYRLPTLEEWQVAARVGVAEPDANRNCRVELGGVSRGGSPVRTDVGRRNDLGVMNAFGNVAEWVTREGELLSVGGSFDDAIDACVSNSVFASDGSPATSQGFRLVREILWPQRRSER